MPIVPSQHGCVLYSFWFHSSYKSIDRFVPDVTVMGVSLVNILFAMVQLPAFSLRAFEFVASCVGAPPSASAIYASRRHLTCGHTVSRCGKCSATVSSPGRRSPDTRYWRPLISQTFRYISFTLHQCNNALIQLLYLYSHHCLQVLMRD